MEGLRKPFQGLWNVTRFNWHFYLLAVLIPVSWYLFRFNVDYNYRLIGDLLSVVVTLSMLLSLIVSWYVYDCSDLYRMKWLDQADIPDKGNMVNIHAGFDETSMLIHRKFPRACLSVFDFYNPKTHTEVSIRRARKAYPAYPGTKPVVTSLIPLADQSTEIIFVLMSAHEIRNDEEQVTFFKELKRTLKDDGKIIVTEHLRNTANFLTYNIGFFHFLQRKTWYKTFAAAGLGISKEIKITPFITTFVLQKDGAAS